VYVQRVTDVLTGKSILVADDDQDNAELMAFLLEQAGAKTRIAVSASKALEILASGWTPDVVALDIGMPEMDGYDLLREIRRAPATSKVPALAVTGYGYERDKAKAAAAGFTVHVVKPYDGEALVHLVASLTSPRPEAPIAAELRGALSASLHAALALLNARSRHRFTGVYRFDGPTLRNVALFDRDHPASQAGDDAPMNETYCSIVGRDRAPFVTADTTMDSRLVDHPARLTVQSYCGVLLRNEDSTPFGSLCHFDLAPVEASNEVLVALLDAAPLIGAAVASV